MWRILGLVVIAGCGSSWVGPPRFGSLRTDYVPRPDFAPSIVASTLDSGLRVVVAPDPRTNLVTIDVRYLFGSADEPSDRPGLAHLVEHMLFESRLRPDGPTLADELAEVALSYNAWTTADELHFTATAPASALDAVLALEVRRLETQCAQLDDATFARERDVVANEELVRAGPGDQVRAALTTALYPAGHRYARAARADAARLSRADVCQFIRANVRPEATVIVVGGRLDPDRVLAQLKAYGAARPMTPPAPTTTPVVPAVELHGASQLSAPIARPVAVIAVPGVPWGSRGRAASDLAALAMVGLIQRAIDDEHPWLRAVDHGSFGGVRAPIHLFFIEVDTAEHLDAAIALFFTTAAESLSDRDVASHRLAARLRGAAALGVVSSWDEVGDRGGTLADYVQYADHAYFMRRDLTEIDGTTLGELRGVIRGFRRDRAYLVRLLPDGDREDAEALVTGSPGGHDVAPWRRPIDRAAASQPLTAHAQPGAATVVERTLGGLTVELAPDSLSPVVDIRLVVAGGVLDEPRSRPGLARVAAALLDHEYDHPYQVADYEGIVFGLERGTQLSTSVEERTTTFRARGLADAPRWHLWRLAWLVDKGVYRRDDLTALRRSVERARSEHLEPDDERHRMFAVHLFGADHPYARPATRSERLLAIKKSDLDAWRRRYRRLDGARLIVSGHFDPDEMWRTIEELFEPMTKTKAPAAATAPEPHPTQEPRWVVERLAVAAQTELAVGYPTASSAVGDRAAQLILAEMVALRIRIVRERMGASYGLASGYVGGAGGSAVVVRGSVAADHASTALVAVLGQLDGLRQPGLEFDRDFIIARRRVLAEVEATSGGARAVASGLAFLARNQRPVDDRLALAAAVAQTTATDVLAVAAKDLAPTRRVVELIGTAASVDAALAAAGGRP